MVYDPEDLRLAAEARRLAEEKKGEELGTERPNFRSIKAATWTGRRTHAEQVEIVRVFAPLALRAAGELQAAIHDSRLNDPAAVDALDALKELHAAIGALIKAADAGLPMGSLWTIFEKKKAAFFDVVSGGFQVMAVAPVVALGTAHVLSYLSGEPITGEMVTTLCATGMVTDAALRVGARQSAQDIEPNR